MKATFIPVLLLLLVLGCGTNINPNDKELANKMGEVDQLFADWKGKRPGGAVGIIKEGKLIYEQYFGLANIEKKEPFSKETITDIGSISKQFTAMCIAILEEKQLLNIEEDIRKYLPEMPEYEQPVKIKNLLFHTSGIKDQEELMLLKGLEPYGAYMTNDFALELIFKQQSLNFLPNDQYEYSNANYVLLTEIIKRVSGQPLEQFAKEQIFTPLGMEQTFFNLNQGADFESKAIGYVPTENGFTKAFYETHVIGDGGIYTTLTDIVKWDANFYNNQLGKGNDSLTERMKYREKLADGQLNNMAFAQIGTMHSFGKESWSHGGGGGGYRSFYIRLEDPQFSVIVLSNSDNSNSFDKANQVVNLFLKDGEKRTKNEEGIVIKKAIKSIKIEEDISRNFSGYYFNEENLLVLKIEPNKKDNQFIINWLDGDGSGYEAILINGETIAEKEDTDYQYELDLTKNLLIHKIKGRTDITFRKMPEFTTSLKEYVGSYYSEELDYKITLFLADNQLQSMNNYFSKLMPIANNKFIETTSKAIISFEKNEVNQIEKLIANIPKGDRSLRNMIFNKIPE